MESEVGKVYEGGFITSKVIYSGTYDDAFLFFINIPNKKWWKLYTLKLIKVCPTCGHEVSKTKRQSG